MLNSINEQEYISIQKCKKKTYSIYLFIYLFYTLLYLKYQLACFKKTKMIQLA